VGTFCQSSVGVSGREKPRENSFAVDGCPFSVENVPDLRRLSGFRAETRRLSCDNFSHLSLEVMIQYPANAHVQYIMHVTNEQYSWNQSGVS
jgi:hypothetical protein